MKMVSEQECEGSKEVSTGHKSILGRDNSHLRDGGGGGCWHDCGTDGARSH